MTGPRAIRDQLTKAHRQHSPVPHKSPPNMAVRGHRCCQYWEVCQLGCVTKARRQECLPHGVGCRLFSHNLTRGELRCAATNGYSTPAGHVVRNSRHLSNFEAMGTGKQLDESESYFFSGSGLSPTTAASSSSRIEAAATTRSPSSRRSKRTPCVPRPASRISAAWTRITFP
jgi:hypothetical protein